MPTPSATLWQDARLQLFKFLDAVVGRKDLVLQDSLVPLIDPLAKFSELRNHAVEHIFVLENRNMKPSSNNLIFIANGEKSAQAQLVACESFGHAPFFKSMFLHIHKAQQTAQQRLNITLIWVPRRTLIAERELEKEHVLGDIDKITDWPLYLLPIQADVLSMELDTSFSDLYLRKDPGPVFLAARAMIDFQSRFGLFSRIHGIGHQSQRLCNLLERLRLERLADCDATFNAGAEPNSSMDELIVLDRNLDFATPLLTQFTFDGLIDEVFGIHNGQVDLDSVRSHEAAVASLSHTGLDRPSQRKIKLDEGDKLYVQLRDMNIALVGSVLNQLSRRLQSDYKGRSADRLAEIRQFVNKLPGYQSEHQSLITHTTLLESILRFTSADTFSRSLEIQQNVMAGTSGSSLLTMVEDLIAQDCSVVSVLRVVCLLSVMSAGFSPKDLDLIKRQITQAYGYEHIATFHALQKMGLIRQKMAISVVSSTNEAGPNYSALSRPLNLLVDDVDLQNPEDVAYVFNGWAPLSIRLVQHILNDEPSQSWEDLAKYIKMPRVDRVQESNLSSTTAVRALLKNNDNPKTTVVFFIGGVTRAEVASLRFTGKADRRILICTTSMINGNQIVQTAIPKVKPP